MVTISNTIQYNYQAEVSSGTLIFLSDKFTVIGQVEYIEYGIIYINFNENIPYFYNSIFKNLSFSYNLFNTLDNNNTKSVSCLSVEGYSANDFDVLIQKEGVNINAQITYTPSNN